MPTEEKNIERFLAVGTIALMHTEANRKEGARFKTVFRGWRRNNHIMADRPRIETGGFANLQEGQKCIMRFVYEGQACAFDTQVLDWDMRRQNAYVRIAWPRQIEYVPFRKYERIRLQLPCSLTTQGGESMTGEITDMSTGGCAIVLQGKYDGSDTVEAAFTLPEGLTIKNARLQVRNARETADGWMLGCEYEAEQDGLRSDITFFVTSMLDRMRLESGQPAAKRVLIVEEDIERGTRLCQHFVRQAFEPIHAQNLVDALYRLRMRPPSALVISQSTQFLTGVDLCRLIKRLPIFETLPIYIYGGEEPGLEKKARDAGATGYFPPIASMLPDIAFDVASDLGAIG